MSIKLVNEMKKAIVLVFIFTHIIASCLPEPAFEAPIEITAQPTQVSAAKSSTTEMNDLAGTTFPSQTLTGFPQISSTALALATNTIIPTHTITPEIVVSPSPEITRTAAFFTVCEETVDHDYGSLMVTFAANRDGDYEIYTMNANGSNLKQITSNEIGDFSPQWSKDGEMLAFIRIESAPGDRGLQGLDENKDRSLWVLDKRGDLIMVTSYFDQISSFTWSNNSQKIAISAKIHGSRDLFIADLKTKNTENLTEEYFVFGPAHSSWSPDDTFIVFQDVLDYNVVWNWLFTIRRDGSDFARVPMANPDNLSEQEPFWVSRDQIILTSHDISSENIQIYSIKPDGSLARQITMNDVLKYSLALSPNGEMVAYRGFKEVWIDNEPDYIDRAIYLANIDGSANEALHKDDGLAARSLSWTPDNHHISFFIKNNDTLDLKLLNICSGEVLSIVDNIADSHPMSWIWP
jgi:TolB protein